MACRIIDDKASNPTCLTGQFQLCISLRQPKLSFLLVVLLRPPAFADINEHVDRTGQSSGRVEQRCRVRDEVNTRAVRAFGYRFLAMDGSLLTQRHRHWAFVMRQRRAIRPVKLPGTAKLAVAEFGAATPKRGRSLVVKGDMTLCISHVDGSRNFLDYGARQPVDLTQEVG